MDIYVCVGSSCHLKGSYDVICIFQNCIKKYNTDDVTLKASFCMGHCTGGVSVKFGDTFSEGVSKNNAEELFKKYVLTAIPDKIAEQEISISPPETGK